METQSRWGFVALGIGFIVLALIVALTTFYFETGSRSPVAVSDRSDAPPNADEDGDGLKTWEESLWGTDPKVSDTDADGVMDGEEVRMNANPLVFGTSAALQIYTPAGDIVDTEKLALDLYDAYASQIESGELSEEDAEALIQDVVAKNFALPDVRSKLTLDDIKASDSVPMVNYLTLATTILRGSTAVKEYELATFSRMVQNPNYPGASQLKVASDTYRGIHLALASLEVPSSVKNEHLAVTNGVGSLANIVSQMSIWSGDPATALVYVSTFTAIERELNDAVTELYARLSVLMKS